MGYLTERFPTTQFVVSAHSPLIVQAASENTNVAVLRREGDHVVIDQPLSSVQGWRIDQVLTSDLFGLETAHGPQFERMIRERRALLTKSRLTKRDKDKLERLNAAVEALPGRETPEDLAAMQLIRRAAERLRQAGE